MSKETRVNKCAVCGCNLCSVDLVIDPLKPDTQILICDECYGERLEDLNKPKEKETEK